MAGALELCWYEEEDNGGVKAGVFVVEAGVMDGRAAGVAEAETVDLTLLAPGVAYCAGVAPRATGGTVALVGRAGPT